MIALLMSTWGAPALATTMGNPLARDEHGDVRVGLGFFGEGPPGAAPTLPSKMLRVDFVPVDNFGLFVDGTWTNTQIDKIGGERLRAWQLAGGGRLAVYPWTSVGFGLIGRASYSRDWTVKPFYLQADGDLITTPTTGATGSTTETTDTTDTTEDTSTGSPFFPAWARGYRADETQRLMGRVVAAMILGVPDTGVYLWFGPRFTIRAGQPITTDDQDRAWGVEFNTNRPLGATIGFEAHSEDILGIGDPRHRWLSFGMEINLIDATGLGVWLGYAF